MSAAPLLTVEQAAELLAMSRSWLLEQARRDAIPHIRLGRAVRFDADELLSWARARQRGPTHRGRERVR